MKTKRKYQVFLSSTFSDLREERNRVFEAILAMGHIPVGMEYFSSRSRSSIEVIKRFLDQCDYQITLIGTRYGSLVNRSAVSFTEMEYDYAQKVGIPQLSFLQRSRGVYLNSSESAKSVERLKNFRAKVSEHQCAYWETAPELSSEVQRALSAEIEENVRPGWIRATDAAEISDEGFKLLEAELSGVKSALDRYRKNVVESNRIRFESNLLAVPNLSGLWQCQEKATTLELFEYGGAIVSHFITGTHEHWLHGLWSPETSEVHVQIWRRERQPLDGKNRRETIMFGRYHNITDSSFMSEIFSTDGKAELLQNYSEKLTWKRLTLSAT
jgi:hypothetical protein